MNFPHLISATSCCIVWWLICFSCDSHWFSTCSSNGSAGNCCWLQAPTSCFFTIKWKPVLFVSSGPKPCEACRQEEIYEEPISILNSNEVNWNVFLVIRMSFLTPALFQRKIYDYSLAGVSFTTTSHNATYYVWLLLHLVALWIHWTVFFAPLPGISRQCRRSRDSKSSCQVFEPGLRLDRLNKGVWGEV